MPTQIILLIAIYFKKSSEKEWNYFIYIFCSNSLIFSFRFAFSLLKSIFWLVRFFICSSRWFRYSFFFFLLMQADSLFLIILICLFMLLISWIFVFDDCILMVSSSDSVLSRMLPMSMVVLLRCILVGLVI